MTDFKGMVKAVKEEKPITLRHEKWLQENSNAQYSPAAIQLAQDVLSGKKGGSRSRKVQLRASGTGSCMRKRIFDLRGEEKIIEIDGITSNIFATGNFLHLKWQMAGLTEGWLAEAEVPVESEELDMAGTMDGILWDGSIFEFKSINARGFHQLKPYGPKAIHRLQVHAYMLLSGRDRASIVYENKDNQDWLEVVINRDEALTTAIQHELMSIREHEAQGTLPPMISDCVAQVGYVFRGCPYRKVCPGKG